MSTGAEYSVQQTEITQVLLQL